jgi:hypothetical protein
MYRLYKLRLWTNNETEKREQHIGNNRPLTRDEAPHCPKEDLR